jgi:hypothetical protein
MHHLECNGSNKYNSKRSSSHWQCIVHQPTHQCNLSPKQWSNGIEQSLLSKFWTADWTRKEGERQDQETPSNHCKYAQTSRSHRSEQQKQRNHTNLPAFHQLQQCRPNSIQAYPLIQRKRISRCHVCIGDNPSTLPGRFSLRRLKLPKQLQVFCFSWTRAKFIEPANRLPHLPFNPRTGSEKVYPQCQSITWADSACT